MGRPTASLCNNDDEYWASTRINTSPAEENQAQPSGVRHLTDIVGSAIQVGSTHELVERLRRCGTDGDPNLKPYERAHIRLERIPLGEIVPLAKYVLEEQLRAVSALRQRLNTAGVDIFELASGIVWPNGQNERAVACPIIEYWEGEGLLLVDGIHRVWVARDEGRTELICAVIRGVAVPLVPLPVSWKKVRLFPAGQGPTEQEKRAYRFSDAQSLRSAFPLVADQVTDDNFRYFLYRNLHELGSSGIRTPLPVVRDPNESPEEK